ncbi:MAG: ketopantoate reductase family protein [Granulosicoccus sp.]|nr:ketopantoate reductase family protein [Granulosicoccus sp.]
MKKIKNVAVLGAGAIGAYFASRFFETPGFNTYLLARGERRRRLQERGLIVNNQHYQIDTLDPADANQAMDLVIVALKHQHLQEAFEHMDPLVNSSTVFISMMNGLESEEFIGGRYGMEQVLYAIVVGLDGQRVENRIQFTSQGVHHFGEADNTTPSDKVKAVQQAFDQASIRYETPADMMRTMWWKFMVNVGINQASAVMGAPYKVFQKSKYAQELKESLMREVVALAEAKGVNLTLTDIKDWYAILNKIGPDGKTSMLQDIEAGRKTEVDIFAGSVIRLGKELGIPTPVNTAVYQIIKVLEES